MLSNTACTVHVGDPGCVLLAIAGRSTNLPVMHDTIRTVGVLQGLCSMATIVVLVWAVLDFRLQAAHTAYHESRNDFRLCDLLLPVEHLQ